MLWSIDAARQCSWVDTVVVSTENPLIAKIAKSAGAQVPYLRPAYLADDGAKTIDVILDIMKFYEKQSMKYDIFVLLQPTSPLRDSNHLAKALKLFMDKRADAVVSVVKETHPSQWSRNLQRTLCMRAFCSSLRSPRNTYLHRLNGAIYIAKWDFLKKRKTWYSNRTYAYVMDRASSVDIDTAEDFWIAELYMAKARGCQIQYVNP